MINKTFPHIKRKVKWYTYTTHAYTNHKCVSHLESWQWRMAVLHMHVIIVRNGVYNIQLGFVRNSHKNYFCTAL